MNSCRILVRCQLQMTYCSQAWQPNKSNLAKFEKVQEIATKWILNASFEYKDRLLQLKLLPLSLYVEMHNLLLLISLDRNEYDVVVDLPRVTEDKTRQHTRGELTIGTNRLYKTDENFFHRTKLLYNIIIRVYTSYGKYLNKDTISKIYWDYFLRKYDKRDKCTWRIVCKCDHCNNWKKLD